MTRPVERRMIILQITRHAEVHVERIATVGINKEIFSDAFCSDKDLTDKRFGKRCIIGGEEFSVFYLNGFDGLVKAGGFKVATIGFNFGKFGHGITVNKC